MYFLFIIKNKNFFNHIQDSFNISKCKSCSFEAATICCKLITVCFSTFILLEECPHFIKLIIVVIILFKFLFKTGWKLEKKFLFLNLGLRLDTEFAIRVTMLSVSGYYSYSGTGLVKLI